MSLSKIVVSLVLYIILFLGTVKAQLPDVGQLPPSVHWYHLLTPHFDLIYASDFEKEAQRMANVLEYIYLKEQKTFPTHPKRIPIVLQNQGVIANGYVRLAPRMSEFFTTPPQEFETNDWLNTLALHELRHVFQFNSLEQKINHLPLSEMFTMALGLPIPFWLFEGDAVVQETVLSNAGRGRLPSWELEFRTNLLSGRDFSYSKHYLGSYKDIVPDYYRMGYYMVSKLRRDYGSGILGHFIRQPIGFLSAFKKASGGVMPKMYFDSTKKELVDLWSKQIQQLDKQNYEIILSADRTNKTSYFLPQKLASGAIVALQNSFNKTPQLVLLNPNARTKLLCRIGYQEQAYFSASQQLLVWDEYRVHPRYTRRNYSVICSYDVEKGIRKQLTHKSRFFAPSLSADAHIIVAVEISRDNTFSLVELDAITGKLLKRYPNPNNWMLQTPRFSSSMQEIVATVVTSKGKSLISLSRTRGDSQLLLPFENQQISQPISLKNGHIVYKAHYNGIDNLYDLDVQQNNIRQLSNSPFGAFSPYYDEKSDSLFFNTYGADGYGISKMKYSTLDKKDIRQISNTFIHYTAPLIKQEFNGNVLDDSIPSLHYLNARYKEFNHLLNFHSIMPSYDVNLDNSNYYNIGGQLVSNNILNTTSLSGYLHQNNVSQKMDAGGSISYKRYLPILGINYDNLSRIGKFSGIDYTVRTHNLSTQVYIPITIYRFNTTYSGLVGVSQNYDYTYDIESANNVLRLTGNRGNFRGTLYTVSVKGLSRMAKQNLYPKFGASLYASYQHYPFSTKIDEILAIQSTFYLPGVLNNHGVSVSFNYQHGTGRYVNYQRIPYVWGYAYFNRTKARVNNTLLLTYTFPIAYPDWNLDSYMLLNTYIKRFRATLFMGFENIETKSEVSPEAYGINLMLDLHLLRFITPLSLGCQFVASPYDKGNLVILPVFQVNF